MTGLLESMAEALRSPAGGKAQRSSPSANVSALEPGSGLGKGGGTRPRCVQLAERSRPLGRPGEGVTLSLSHLRHG